MENVVEDVENSDIKRKENERILRLIKLLNSLATRIPVVCLKRAEDEFPIIEGCTVSLQKHNLKSYLLAFFFITNRHFKIINYYELF